MPKGTGSTLCSRPDRSGRASPYRVVDPNKPADLPGEESEEPGPSRTDRRRERKRNEAELVGLARDLVLAPERWLQRLALSESVLDAVLETRRIQSPPARNRALRRVRQVLRNDD